MPRIIPKPPYSLLARFYDQISLRRAAMSRSARKAVLRDILPKFRSVCDLGCGSGTAALGFARQGLRVFAVDRSPQMCQIVRQKARGAGLPIRVVCSDMRDFRLPEPVDLVTCEFNTIGHLLRKADLLRAMRSVARALSLGGWFYFDVIVPAAQRHKLHARQKEWGFEGPDFLVVISGSFDHHRGRETIDLNWFLPAGKLWRRYRERMEVKYWRAAAIRAVLRRTGFRAVRMYEGAQLHPQISFPNRTCFFLARKPLSPRGNG